MQESVHAACMQYFNWLHLPGMAGIAEAFAGMCGVPCDMEEKITLIKNVYYPSNPPLHH